MANFDRKLLRWTKVVHHNQVKISSGSFNGVLMLGAAYERSDVCIEVRAENKLDMEKEDILGEK